MDKETFKACAKRLTARSTFGITFKEDGVEGLRSLLYLVATTKGASFHILDEDKLGLREVAQSGNWGDTSKTVYISGTSTTETDQLARLTEHIESVTVGSHFAKAIFTAKNAEERQAVLDRIMEEMLNPQNGSEKLFFKLEASLIDIDGLPAIKFKIADDSGLELIIDGWSGFTQIHNPLKSSLFLSEQPTWGTFMFTSVDNARGWIASEVSDYFAALARL